jgi:hypothetical protein
MCIRQCARVTHAHMHAASTRNSRVGGCSAACTKQGASGQRNTASLSPCCFVLRLHVAWRRLGGRDVAQSRSEARQQRESPWPSPAIRPRSRPLPDAELQSVSSATWGVAPFLSARPSSSRQPPPRPWPPWPPSPVAYHVHRPSRPVLAPAALGVRGSPANWPPAEGFAMLAFATRGEG